MFQGIVGNPPYIIYDIWVQNSLPWNALPSFDNWTLQASHLYLHLNLIFDHESFSYQCISALLQSHILTQNVISHDSILNSSTITWSVYRSLNIETWQHSTNGSTFSWARDHVILVENNFEIFEFQGTIDCSRSK